MQVVVFSVPERSVPNMELHTMCSRQRVEVVE